MANRMANNMGQDIQVPDWGNALTEFHYPLLFRMENIKVGGEGLFSARIGVLSSFVIKFTEPRFYTENIQIRIIEDISRDVVLDVVPFQTAKGYGIRAFYILTKPGRVRLSITVDGVTISHIPVPVEENDDYVNSLEMSNLTLLRLMSQETEQQRLENEELKAVMNELCLLTVELPKVCQAALQSVAEATERSEAVVNRAKNLLQQYPHALGQPAAQGPQDPDNGSPPAQGPHDQGNGSPPAQGPHDAGNGSPPAQGPQDPGNGSPPAPADADVGHSPPHFSPSQQLPTQRSSADGLKRKSDDDMEQQVPKKGRWSAPSALERADEGEVQEEEAPVQRSSEERASASPTPTDGSQSTDVTGELNRLLDSLIERARQMDEAQNEVPADEESWRLAISLSPEKRPFSPPAVMEGGLERSWSLRCSASPTPTDFINRAPCPGVPEGDGPSKSNPLEDFFRVSSSDPETISSTSTKSSRSFRSSASAVSPCPSLSSRTSRQSSRSAISRVSSASSIQGSPCPSLSSRTSRRSSRSSVSSVSSVPAIRGSPCPSLDSTDDSTDEDDSPRRNPRFNPYYWMRPLPRKNYRS